MEEIIIKYKTNTASQEEMFAHLLACSPNFVPPLQDRLDISAYAKKLIGLAINFEAWNKNVLVGLIAVYINKTQQSGFITNVSVVKEFMGNGIAGKLLDAVIVYAETVSVSNISLEVNKENEGAISFYAKNGFTQTGSKEDSLIMQKEID